MRKVTVISTQKNTPVSYNTTATTWGQLKDTIALDFGNLAGMKATIKETRNSLEVNDASLPEGDFTLFLTQTRIKAGGVDMAQMLNALKEEFTTAFDSVLERLDNGEFDVETSHENVAVSNNRISAEDRAALEALQQALG